jgi:hypothetical protein
MTVSEVFLDAIAVGEVFRVGVCTVGGGSCGAFLGDKGVVGFLGSRDEVKH